MCEKTRRGRARSATVVGGAAFAALAVAEPALAHEATGSAAGLVSGLLHPVSGADHIAAMVAVGLWGAQLGKPALWALPVVFPLVMAFGGFLGLVGAPLPGVEIGIAASAVTLGLMVVAQAKPPMWLSMAMVGAFAIFHGHAHGTELHEGESGVLYSIGFVVSTGLLHGVGIGLGMLNHLHRGEAAVRALGGIVVVAGVYFLWGALT